MKDTKFRNIADRYKSVEMNIFEDTNMLKKEKAKLHSLKQNKDLSRKGIAWALLFTAVLGLCLFIPMAVPTQIVIAGLALTSGLTSAGLASKTLKYSNQIEDTEKTIGIVEERLAGYEEERKQVLAESRDYFGTKQTTGEKEKPVEMPSREAPENTAKPMPAYNAPKSDAKPMLAYEIKDDELSM